MSDALVYESSSMDEMTGNIFVKKDWLNIIDSNNGNYGSNQLLIDSSALANSNKWLSYRESYLSIPLVLTANNAVATGGTSRQTNILVNPNASGSSCDAAFGLKNWFGQIFHSMSVEFNGTTIIQQTPFSNIYNHFKLMTSLSWNDVWTKGASIGFYPDDPLGWGFTVGANGDPTGVSTDGVGTFNNRNYITPTLVNGLDAQGNQGNIGLTKRQQFINYDPAGLNGGGTSASSTILPATSATTIYKSYVSGKNGGTGNVCFIQYSIMATVYLKHLHNFFEQIPLMKGVFMRMTLNLNQSLITLTSTIPASTPDNDALATNWRWTKTDIQCPSGGTCPIMIASSAANNAGVSSLDFGVANVAAVITKVAYVSLCVGRSSVFSQQSNIASQSAFNTPVMMYIPAYTFSAPYESAYISSPIKKIRYSDVYFYSVPLVERNQSFNQILTNGIAGIKSVLVCPYYTTDNAYGNAGLQPYQSPFDTAPATTSPLCMLSQFQILVGGQQMIYQNQRYTFEAFNNHLVSANAVNGAMTDGLTSGLIDKLGFENSYCYYYVNCSRMSDVERAYPKSVQIQGQNVADRHLQLLCFIEYEQEISVDVLTGARV